VSPAKWGPDEPAASPPPHDEGYTAISAELMATLRELLDLMAKCEHARAAVRLALDLVENSPEGGPRIRRRLLRDLHEPPQSNT
jgi:hypothetical protein